LGIFDAADYRRALREFRGSPAFGLVPFDFSGSAIEAHNGCIDATPYLMETTRRMPRSFSAIFTALIPLLQSMIAKLKAKSA
jgi:hypothetical protein